MALTIEQIQTNITNKMDARLIINQIADYLQDNPSGGGSSYLVYTALISQSGTDAPIATVFENTLGSAVVWSREGVGDYRATNAAFTEARTLTPPSYNDYYGMLSVFNSAVADYVYGFGARDGHVNINVFAVDGNNAELSTAIGAQKIFVEFRVYP